MCRTGTLCVILAAVQGSTRAEPKTTWAREIAVGGKRIIAWEPPQQARAASLLGQDSACEGGAGTCVVSCADFACSAAQVRCAALAWCVGFSRPSVGGSFAAAWARMVLKKCSSERWGREKRFYVGRRG